MSSAFGNKLKIQIFGQSHSKGLGVVMDGIPAGMKIDLEEVQRFLDRRAGGKNAYSTARKEADTPTVLSGLVGDTTCGAPLCAIFENANTKSGDYDKLKGNLRPSHADYAAWMKYNGYQDRSGGGQFSGRLTLPLCFAGAVCIQLLRQQGVEVSSHILSIGEIQDEAFDLVDIKQKTYLPDEFPVLNAVVGEEMVAYMTEIAKEGDSVGGIVECAFTGMPVGVGEPIYDNVESCIARVMFGVPAVKGIEFGMGFAGVKQRGSECNDAFYLEGDQIKTKTNNSGGIQGGITNGMPVVFRVALKPTPSIYKEQETVNFKEMTENKFHIEGRHDPCIVPRALPCVEAAAAVALYDLLLEK